MDDLSGQIIRGYELRERIGAGGFGAVYRAHQTVIGREVAIKIILPEHANQPDFIRRFEAEAQMVARLEHPHIVPLYDYWREPNGAYLVMRFLRGGSLRTALRNQGAWTPERILPIIEQIAAALTVAHRLGVIHRDLKPDNILLDEDGNAYLADFGIAKDLSATDGTRSSMIVGSPDYLTPEQIEGQPLTAQTDIYTLGLVLYEMLTGEKPFTAPSLMALMNKHLNETLPALSETRPSIPPAIDAVIQRATQKDPAERYPDAMAMAADLRAALAGRGMDRGVTGVEVDYEPTLMPTRREAVGAASITPGVQNPYKGLRSFQSADAADFFGRDALIQQLISRMDTEGEAGQFLAVVGPSGSGKSSVVKAGLIPALRAGAIAGSDQWFVVEMTPGMHPLEELEIALLRVATNPPSSLMEQLRADNRGLLRAVGRVLPPDDGSELLLIIDQFEEVFTMLDDEGDRAHFLDSLLTAVSDPRSRLRVIITLRADFYDRPLLYSDFGFLFRKHTEVVLPLSKDEMHQAIIQPAERVGLRLEPGLVEAIIADVGEQPGTLPLLQYALTELYERRRGNQLTLEAYRNIGGAMGALARRADQIYTELDKAGQNAARQMFLRLVVPGEGTEDTRRRVLQAELTSLAGNETAIREVIELYGKYRLLTFDRDPITRGPTVEVAHEALIRSWSRLGLWLDSSREDLRMQRLLMGRAEEWRRAGRDASFLLPGGSQLTQFEEWATRTEMALAEEERAYLEASSAKRKQEAAAELERQARELALERRSQRFLRALVGFLFVATIGALGLSAFAFDQSQQAQNNAATATIAQGQALLAADEAQIQAATATVAQGQALIQADNAETQAAIAQQNALTATIAQGQALIAATQAQLAAFEAETQAAIAQENALTATLAQGEALIQAEVAETQAALAAENALAAAAAAAESRSRALAAGAQQALSAGQPDVAVALALAAQTSMENPPGEAEQALFAAASGSWIRNRLRGHDSWVETVAFSPDGLRALSGSIDRTLILWDVATGAILERFDAGHNGPVQAVAFSPDGALALSGGVDNRVLMWDIESGEMIRAFEGHTGPVQSVSFSPDGAFALSGAGDGAVILWDAGDGRIIHRLQGHNNWVYSASFAPPTRDGRGGLRAASAAGDGLLILWDLDSGEEIRRFSGHNAAVREVVFSPDGHTILSGAEDDTLILWDAATGEALRTFAGHTNDIYALAISPDGTTALSGSRDTTAILWDIATGKPIRRFQGHTSTIGAITYSPDGRSALSGAFDNSLILWDVASNLPVRPFQWHTNEVFAVAFGSDGNTALSAGIDGTPILWDVNTGAVLRTFAGHTNVLLAAAIGSDGRTAATGGFDDSIILWNLGNGDVLRRFTQPGHTDQVEGLDFSPDGRYLISASRDNTLILWDILTGDPVRTFTGHSDMVTSVHFSPDGARMISSSGDERVIVWEVATGDIIHTLTGHSDSVADAAFSPDGVLVISGGFDNAIILWDALTGDEIRRYQGHTGLIQSVRFSPDGAHLLSTSTDNTLILWDVATGAALQRFQAHRGEVYDAVFSPDGITALSASQDTSLILWNIPSDFTPWVEWLLANRYIPELTCEQRSSYNLEPLCVDGIPPATATNPAQLAALPTATPSPVATPTATASPVPTGTPDALLIEQLAGIGIARESGFVAAQIERVTLSLGGVDNAIREELFPGSYTSFAVGATIAWGPGDPEDYCGLNFRIGDLGNFYAIQINRENELWFSPRINERWGDSIDGNGTLIEARADGRNQIVLVAQADVFTVYINGQLAGQFQDNRLGAGRVSLIAATFEHSEQTACTFTDAWVWDFAFATPAPIASPTLTPSPTLVPPDRILTRLDEIGIPRDSGFLAAELDRHVIDLSDVSNVFRRETFDGSYADFVIGTTIQWGPGATEDQCGFLFRVTGESLYNIAIDRDGDLTLDERDGSGNWLTPTLFGDGSAIRRGRNDRNELIVVGIDDTFSVFINGVYAHQFSDDTLPRGAIALAASTFDESDETRCTFTDSWVWDMAFSQPALPTLTPSPTFTPTATPTASPPVLRALAGAGIGPDSGYIVEVINERRISFTADEDNLIRWQSIGGRHTDFVIGTTIEWGPGATEDQCGFRFRSLDDLNYYTMQINRDGELWLDKRVDNIWQTSQFGNGAFINTAPDAINDLLMVVVGDTFTVWVNGELSYQISDSAFTEGTNFIMAGTYDESDESWCTFTNAWVWDLAFDQPVIASATPTLTPTMTTTPPPSAAIEGALALAGFGVESGYLGAQIPSMVIDLSDRDNWITAEFFDGGYTDFVVGTTIEWGPGATEDQCGFRFRSSGEGYYVAHIDRDGDLEFLPRIDDRWQTSRFGDGSGIDTRREAVNTLMLVGLGDTYTVYINGQYADVFADDQLMEEGRVGLVASTFDESEATHCTFTDAWVWAITDPGASAGPVVSPTPSPTLTPPSTPMSTPSPSPTGRPDSGAIPAGILKALGQLGYDERSGALGDEVDAFTIDLTGEDNLLRYESLTGTYTDFVLAATVQRDEGADDDMCGLRFRGADSDNYYVIQIDRGTEVLFWRRVNGTWQEDISANTTLIDTRIGATHTLMIVGIGESFAFYINGQPVAEFTDSALAEGLVGVAATTFTNSNQAGCEFTDIWVWDLQNPEPAAVESDLPQAVVAGLALTGFEANSGELVAQDERTRISFEPEEDNLIRWERIASSQANFIVGTTIEWGPGATEDQCGLRLRAADNTNFYTVQIDRQGDLWFDEQADGEWGRSQFGDGRAINTQPDGLNEMIVVALNDRFIVYVNGQISAEFRDETLTEGDVFLLAGTFEASDETWCTFTDSWVWGFTGPTVFRPPSFQLDPSGVPPAIIAALNAAELSAESGQVADQISRIVIDMTGRDNVFLREDFDGEYADFVTGASIAWGPGATEDQCGFLFRFTDAGLYNIWISREGALGFDQRTGSEWARTRFGDGGAIRTEADSTNDLVIVAIGGVFDVYLNGRYVDRFQDDALASGIISLMGATFEGSDESFCSFTDAWVWELG